MSTSIFVNLPTQNLERAKAFYTGLGWSINPMFSDENGACVVIDENIYLMVITREFFATFTDKQITDPRVQIQTNLSFSQDSREDVDAMVQKGLAAGGTEPRPAQDYGYMYSRDLDDPDGNNLGFFSMVPEAVEKGPEASVAEQPSA